MDGAEFLEDEIGEEAVVVQVEFDDNDYNDEVGDDQELDYGDDEFVDDFIQTDGANDNVRIL